MALCVATVTAQHKIPPLPETAGKPVRTPSGLTYIDIKVGTGVQATRGRLVRVLYTAWVTKTELMFDYRDQKTPPLAFHVGRSEGGVLRGVDEGVRGMRVGGIRRLIIPARLGHGSKGTKLVPPNSQLTYDVELVAVARPGV